MIGASLANEPCCVGVMVFSSFTQLIGSSMSSLKSLELCARELDSSFLQQIPTRAAVQCRHLYLHRSKQIEAPLDYMGAVGVCRVLVEY